MNDIYIRSFTGFVLILRISPAVFVAVVVVVLVRGLIYSVQEFVVEFAIEPAAGLAEVVEVVIAEQVELLFVVEL